MTNFTLFCLQIIVGCLHENMFHSVRLGVLCITLELILNPLHSFAELWPRGRISSLAVLEVGVDGGCIKGGLPM